MGGEYHGLELLSLGPELAWFWISSKNLGAALGNL